MNRVDVASALVVGMVLWSCSVLLYHFVVFPGVATTVYAKIQASLQAMWQNTVLPQLADSFSTAQIASTINIVDSYNTVLDPALTGTIGTLSSAESSCMRPTNVSIILTECLVSALIVAALWYIVRHPL
jgi:hypothetical protein